MSNRSQCNNTHLKNKNNGRDFAVLTHFKVKYCRTFLYYHFNKI